MCILFIVTGIIFIFTNQSYADETVENNTDKILESIKDKTYKKYNIGTYKISSNVISIEIIGNAEYYNSVKSEIETLVKNAIKSTAFENYSIDINQSKINQIVSEEHKEELVLVKDIYMLLSKSYPNQIDQVDSNNTTQELSVKVKTLLDENQKPTEIGKEMENKINEVLEGNSNKLLKEKPIKIYIYNKQGEKIN